MLRLFDQLWKAHQKWRADHGSLLAAAVAYYAALSFFPLLLVLISALGIFMQWTAWGHDAENQILSTIGDYASPEVEAGVGRILKQVQRKATLSGPIGVGLLVFAAAALFAHFERAFDRIWNVDRRPADSIVQAMRRIALFRLRAFFMLVALLSLVLVVFLVGVTASSLKTHTLDILPAAEWVWWTVESGASMVLNWGLFTLLYGLLPKVKVRWSEAARGGLLAAAAWEVGRLALTFFLVTKKYNAYGVVGSFIAVMLWIYFASTVVLMGAEYVQVVCEDASHVPSTPMKGDDQEEAGGG